MADVTSGMLPGRGVHRRRIGLLSTPPVSHFWLLVIGVLVVGFLLNDGFDLLLVSFIAIYGIATVGLNLIFGVGGMLSVAQGALVEVGAYAAALLMTKSGLPFVAAAAVAVVIASLLSFAFTFAAARVRTHYFVLISLAAAEIVSLIVTGSKFTGAFNGLGTIPPMSVGGLVASTTRSEALVGVVLLIVVWYVADVFKASRVGRAVFISSLNEELAATCGINVLRGRLAVAALGGAFAGLAGVIYASTTAYIDPGSFTLSLALLFLVSVVVGGTGSIPWTVFGAVVFTYLNNGLPGLTSTGPLIYGLVVVAVLLVAPGGLASLTTRGLDAVRARSQARRSEPDLPRSSETGVVQ